MKRGTRTSTTRRAGTETRRAGTETRRGTRRGGKRGSAEPAAKPEVPAANPDAVLEFFAEYSDESRTQIDSNGLMKLCEGLGIDPATDVTILLIVWKCECRQYGVITKAEFLKGMEALHADSLNSLKNRLSTLQEIAADPSSKDFQRFFKFVFLFCIEPPATVMDIDTASVMMPMLIGNHFPLTEKFLHFVKEVQQMKVLNNDQWTSWLEACKTTNGDFINNYDEDGAWPLVIDEFYYWLKEGN